MHHMTEPREIQIFSSLYLQVLSASHLYYSVSHQSTFTLLFFYLHLSTLPYFQLLFIFSHFIHYILHLVYLISDPSRPLYLLFISIFMSDFILHFHQYSICSIMLYIDSTIYSILTIDSAFGLLTSVYYITIQVCIHSDPH